VPNPLIREAVAGLPQSLLERSGSVFYSGQSAFAKPSDVYILGLNPGGDAISQSTNTIGLHIENWSTNLEPFSAYLDEAWNGRPKGASGMQPRVNHLANSLRLDLRSTPSGNLVFARSQRAAALGSEAADLITICWPVHAAVVESLRVRLIICFGHLCGKAVRARLRANHKIGSFRETYPNRSWESAAHCNSAGHVVLTLTHPSIADWTNGNADPSHFVVKVMEEFR